MSDQPDTKPEIKWIYGYQESTKKMGIKANWRKAFFNLPLSPLFRLILGTRKFNWFRVPNQTDPTLANMEFQNFFHRFSKTQKSPMIDSSLNICNLFWNTTCYQIWVCSLHVNAFKNMKFKKSYFFIHLIKNPFMTTWQR